MVVTPTLSVVFTLETAVLPVQRLRRSVAIAFNESGTYPVCVRAFPIKPRVWSEKPLADLGVIGFGTYDLAPDGKRVAALMPAETPKAQQANN